MIYDEAKELRDEIERLHSIYADLLLTERNEAIEECALTVEAYLADAAHYCDVRSEVAAVIRALKDKKP